MLCANRPYLKHTTMTPNDVTTSTCTCRCDILYKIDGKISLQWKESRGGPHAKLDCNKTPLHEKPSWSKEWIKGGGGVPCVLNKTETQHQHHDNTWCHYRSTCACSHSTGQVGKWEWKKGRVQKQGKQSRGVPHVKLYRNMTPWHHVMSLLTWQYRYTMSSLWHHQCHLGQLTKEYNEYPNVAILPRLGKLTYSYSTSGRTCCGLWLTRLLYLLPIPTFHKQNLNTIWIFIWTSGL